MWIKEVGRFLGEIQVSGSGKPGVNMVFTREWMSQHKQERP
jgi:hypothetical protein